MKPVFLVLGCNTDVGKTLVSAGVVATAAGAGGAGASVCYVKPWQTGFPQDSDARTVVDAARSLTGREIRHHTISAYHAPLSPHAAARREGLGLTDAAVMAALAQRVEEAPGLVLVEGAGGVASPTPEGALQCDVLRSLRAPVILVGDPKLGGIGATLAAYEMLRARGFPVPLIVLRKGSHGNGEFLAEHLAREGNKETTVHVLDDFREGEGLDPWLARNAQAFGAITAGLRETFDGDSRKVRGHSRRGGELLWWPFTQHGQRMQGDGRDPDSATPVVTSALGDELHFHGEGPLFDACASWWTQCLGHAHPGLVRAAVQAAAQYGHVMFPENAHGPAVDLAEALLAGAGRGWASRVFYSDNGSTAAEVALKMAFRLRLSRLGREPAAGLELSVLGLRDSYHGDTLGVMDAASPNAFNAKEPWYHGRGHWLPFPTVRYEGDGWSVEATAEFAQWVSSLGAGVPPCFPARFSGRAELFSGRRRESDLAACYLNWVEAELDARAGRGQEFGALLLEPVVHGSGGMILVDPLFQSTLAMAARRRGIPVVYDEVFTGFWRLGFERALDVLHVAPDISCHSKSLTGGLVPLGVTLANAETFDAFRGASKLDALLHGHSYTAYPVGCAVALEALGHLAAAARVWSRAGNGGMGAAPFCVFEEARLARLARHGKVESAWALGTVFAFALRSGAKGYGSQDARTIVSRLRGKGIYARPLGNVLYGMTSLTTSAEAAQELIERYFNVLDAD